MTDIVERLRYKIPLTIADIWEAADEIERLREAHAFAIRVVEAANGKKGRPARWSEPPEV
jgi:hypothetical protein